MNAQQKQRLAEIKKHLDTQCQCDKCFLLTLLDQAQRDTERLDWMDAKRTAHIYDHFKHNPSNAATCNTWREAIDQAAGEGEK